MTINQFREDIIETELSYEFLRDCLEYVNYYGQLNDLYKELKLDKFTSIEEILETTDSKIESARAVYFGNIQNWNDDYFFYDGAKNICSENQYQYEQHYIDYKEDIMLEIIDFIDEEDFKNIKTMEELVDFIKNCIL